MIGASGAMTPLERAVTLAGQLTGLALLAAVIALVGAVVFRWYARDRIPGFLAILLGLSAVALVLNTTSILGEVISGSEDVTRAQEALFNIAAFVMAGVGARIGARVGDGSAATVFQGVTVATIDDGVGRVVKAVGRVITVELPDEIEDVLGYDPVPTETKEALSGRRFVFPRGLTVDQLRERLVTRLRTDYAVGHVDVEIEDDGSVSYLGLGSRPAGLGPTLPPGMAAIAIRADPAFAASSGDLVQVWAGDPPERILTGELRGVAGDAVTLAVDAADARRVDPSTTHRLVTLPLGERADREFAALLRSADETHTSVTVAPGSPLDGMTIGALDVTVIAITPPDAEVDALPAPTRVIAAGDVVHAIARPEALRRLTTAAEAVPAGSPDE
ncbi:MAG: TrkA C-terminal domain-containing protein [Salinirussus sp.]